jgi:hypothetical protein
MIFRRVSTAQFLSPSRPPSRTAGCGVNDLPLKARVVGFSTCAGVYRLLIISLRRFESFQEYSNASQ